MKKEYYLYIIIAILISIIAYLCYDKNFFKDNSQPEDTFQRGLECQELLNKYKADKPSPEYVLVWWFYSPVEKTCIWYYMDTLEPMLYQIDDLLWGLNSYYQIFDSDLCACQSDFLWGSYNPNQCDRYHVQRQRDNEINWLKWIWEKPEL